MAVHPTCQNFADDHMFLFAKFPKLKSLRLNGTKVSSKGLVYLQGLFDLEVLELSTFGIIDDVGLVSLKPLTNLKRLSLVGQAQVTDVGLEYLYALTKLTEVELQGTNVTPEGVTKLQQRLPKAKIVLKG